MAEKAEKKPTFKYYYSKSASHTLAGFIPEAYYPNGKRKNGDIPIKFNGHFVITDDPKVQKFIESQSCYGEGEDHMIRGLTEQQYDEMQVKHAKKFVREVATSSPSAR